MTGSGTSFSEVDTIRPTTASPRVEWSGQVSWQDTGLGEGIDYALRRLNVPLSVMVDAQIGREPGLRVYQFELGANLVGTTYENGRRTNAGVVVSALPRPARA